jgi:hypothetical protein
VELGAPSLPLCHVPFDFPAVCFVPPQCNVGRNHHERVLIAKAHLPLPLALDCRYLAHLTLPNSHFVPAMARRRCVQPVRTWQMAGEMTWPRNNRDKLATETQERRSDETSADCRVWSYVANGLFSRLAKVSSTGAKSNFAVRHSLTATCIPNRSHTRSSALDQRRTTCRQTQTFLGGTCQTDVQE